ncbi:2-aminoethylphosphonate--pyruvate transaminase-like [Amphibalanus amphitrite]|uniref:2-aminoethylphosphonate--pyruvate transaminase-like n=1 Tax=Amphibalanus amphitrite TaxID=1232801 RepID=UPI001C90AE1A|nr:2-aminoethylphosphonate--pyruvate transaminase-like [Amphibalanus amphitrite]
MEAGDESASTPQEDKRLFTPGPLNTRLEVRQAMLRDLGSRDAAFISTVKDIRRGLLELAGVSDEVFTAVPMQGSGTFSVEAVLQTASPRDGAKVLILSNGAYGRRQAKVCQAAGIPYTLREFPEDRALDVSAAEELLASDSFTTVTAVHCETSSGVLNPVQKMGQAVRRLQPHAAFVVDSMSAFGAVPLDLEEAGVDYLVSSANKCIEGVPGFAFAICRLKHLETTKGNSRSLSLDLYEQWFNLESTGQFRFTPPTHTMLAFHRALRHLLSAGGVATQADRYRSNNVTVKRGLTELGFRQLVRDGDDCYIITSFLCPSDPLFSFSKLYRGLSERGLVIYPGKVTEADCFRVGNIGDLHQEDMVRLVEGVRDVLKEMGVTTPVRY